MLIMNQKKNGIFTLDNIDGIFVDGNFIQIATADTTGIIASYKTEERSMEVLHEIVECYALSVIFKYDTTEKRRLEIIKELSKYGKFGVPCVYALPAE